MARRKIYSNLNKIGQYRPDHVDGQTLYKVSQSRLYGGDHCQLR